MKMLTVTLVHSRTLPARPCLKATGFHGDRREASIKTGEAHEYDREEPGGATHIYTFFANGLLFRKREGR